MNAFHIILLFLYNEFAYIFISRGKEDFIF